MAGIRIRNKEDFERWLNGIADENQRRRVAAALATRSAMRVLPVAGIWHTFITALPTFRATHTFWFVAAGSKHNSSIYKPIRAASRAAHAVVDSATRASQRNRSAFAAIRSIHTVAITTDIFTTTNATTVAIQAVGASISTAAAIRMTRRRGASRAATSLWKALEADIHFLESFYFFEKYDSISLLDLPLWPQGTPDWAAKLWHSMKSRLLAREGEHWEVWTNWYDARLDPSQPIPCYSPPDMELERQRVLLPEDLWEQGPATVNAAIKELIANHECSEAEPPPPPPPPREEETTDTTQETATPKIPQQEPATIEVEWVDERLMLKPRPLQAAGMSDAELLATLQALGKQVRQLAQLLREDSSANAIDQRITQQLEELVELIPQRPPIDESAAIQLALQVEELRAYFGGMSEEERQGWPEILRRKLETQLQIFHAFLDRFRTWEKVDEENAQSLSDAEIEAAQDIADEVSRGLEELGEERVDPDIVQLLRRLKERLASTQASALRLGKVIKERAADLLKSVGNIFKAIGGWLVRKLTTFGRALDKAIDRELKKLAQQLAKWGRRIIFPGSPLAAGGYIAQKFGWLASLLQWLKDYFPALF